MLNDSFVRERIMKQTQLQNHALMQQILEQKSSFLLQFGGQGTGYLGELKQIYQQYSPAMGDYFSCLFETLQKEYEEVQSLHPEWYSLGYDLKGWLEGGLKASDPELSKGVYSGPLILATQIGHYLRFLHSGVDQEALLKNTLAAIGHSQGIHAALLVARGLEGDAFLRAFSDLLRVLFWQGYRCREAFAPVRLGQDLLSGWDGSEPTPMASIRCSGAEELKAVLFEFEKHHRDLSVPEVGLRNGPDSFVLTGHTASLARFAAHLAARHEHIAATLEFLNVSGPYHSTYMQSAVDRLADDLVRIGLDLDGSQLQVPVLDPLNGNNLQQSGDLSQYVVEASTVRKVDWHQLMQSVADLDVSHALSFGPGDGVRALGRSYLQPGGVVQLGLHRKSALEEVQRHSTVRDRPWSDYAPVQGRLPDGSPIALNAYSRFTGRHPVFGGGMTPTTAEIDIVLAAARTGRIVEWAGGGQVTEKLLRERLDRLVAELPPGQGIVLNLLYLDAYLWNLQYPLVRKLKEEGYPIEGVTISAGVPDKKEALEILENLESSGLWLNSFKPGTHRQIAQVLDIASARPDRKIIMQIEGGAAGGHHSWETLEDLVSANYGKIRANKNIILTVGGGIHDPQQASQWLQGTWTQPRMPVDGVFLGTRLMATKEAATSSAVKESLVELAGANWQEVQNHKHGGGVVSGRSGLGADIFYASNHWSATSAYLEKLLSGSSGAEADAIIEKNRTDIVEALNRTAKPYFGDVGEMTYSSMLRRFLELVAPGDRLKSPEGRWPDEPFIDASFRSRWQSLVERTQGRFADAAEPSVVETNGPDPETILDSLEKKHPEICHYPVLPEDKQYFLEVCKRPGKPVNFIPYLDESLIKWYRSDSLWYSHCEGIDPDSCAWIPGPVSVASVRKVDEPVVEVLQSFESAIYQSARPSSEVLELAEFNLRRADLDEHSAKPAALDGQSVTPGSNGGGDGHHSANALPAELTRLCLQSRGTICHLLQVRTIGRGHNRITSLIPDAFSLEKDQQLGWELAEDGSIRLLRSYRLLNSGEKEQVCELEKNGDRILFRRFPLAGVPAYTTELVDTALPYNRFRELGSAAETSGNFYRSLWNLDEEETKNGNRYSFILNEDELQQFARATDAVAGSHRSFSIVAIWKPMLRALFEAEACGDVLQLVHLFQEFEWSTEYASWKPGQRAEGEASLERIRWTPAGKEVHVRGRLRNQQRKDMVTFRSGFLIRGERSDETLEKYWPESLELLLSSQSALKVLRDTGFIQPGSIEIGQKILIGPEQASIEKKRDGSSRWLVKGLLYQHGLPVGKIDLDWQGTSRCPLDTLLELFAPSEEEKPLDRPVLLYSEKDESPLRLDEYASASGDLNPIHLDSQMAKEAGFDGPIVHGMWTSARILDSLVRNVARGEGNRLRSFRAEFQAPLFPGEVFFIRTRHMSNTAGRSNLDVEALTESGRQIFRGRAQMDPLPTAYVFTGQGSQSKGMGMRFYESYEAARHVWDAAEAVTTAELGFSILEIVRNNPEEIRIGHEIQRHPKGVLNLTQFTQVGLVTKAMADWAILQDKGLLASDACFAGHSLGEYAALASQGILPLSSVIRIVYHRGLTMQSLVTRDAQGNSPYRMTVVLGNRKAGLSEDKIQEIVSMIQDSTDLPLEIVNFNIRDRQYSVTGHLDAIEALEKELRRISGGHKTFVRIPGIDVPFHSGILLPGVPAFREVLRKNLGTVTGLDILDGRYIPNLVARPFSLDSDFLQEVDARTGSPVLKEIRQGKHSEEEKRKLLLIELLAYQFAQPVLWIQTQEYLFKTLGIRRFIDIGARGDLAGMARQTLRQLGLTDAVDVMHIEEDESRVLQTREDAPDLFVISQEKNRKTAAADPEDGGREESEKAESHGASEATASISVPPTTNSPVSEAATSSTRKNTGGGSDVTIDARDGLLAVLAWKAEVRPDELREGETIDELFGGNSSKRNQALADLSAEFNSSELEGVQEKKISEVTDLLKRKVSYSSPGPYLRSCFESFLREYMPPGRGRAEVLDYLRSRSAPEGLILLCTIEFPLLARSGQSSREGALSSMAPQKRFSSKDQADQWIEKALLHLASQRNISLQTESQESGGSVVDSAALADLEARYFGLEGSFARLVRATSQTLLGQDPYAALLVQDRLAVEAGSRALAQEHGKQYDSVIQSKFDARKVVQLDNPFPWIRKNLYREFWDLMRNERQDFSAELYRQVASCESHQLEAMLAYMHRKSVHRHPDVAGKLQLLERALHQGAGAYYPLHGELRCQTMMSEDGQFRIETLETDEDWVTKLLRAGRGLQRTDDEGQTFQKEESETEKYLTEFPSRSKPLDLRHRCVLVTGAGPGSIALEVVKDLISAGATVILGTSTYTDARLEYYKNVYQTCGAMHSRCIIVPFSQGSLSDIRAFVSHAFELGFIPDTLVPFGALGEEGDLASVDTDSLAGLRVMLLGVQALLSATVDEYKSRYLHQPFQLILPLSPNHGAFGKDGLYAESKLALEVMLRKWFSEYESWGRYCSIRAVRIGWVRSTGLMALNDVVAPEMEQEHGIRTFHSAEMGALITGLIGYSGGEETGPLLADFTGGLITLPGLRQKVQSIRQRLLRQSSAARELSNLRARLESPAASHLIQPLERYRLAIGEEEEQDSSSERGKPSVGLEELVCVVGFGEVSPGGSTRTRWELEKGGPLSLEATVEIAWTMGLIEYQNTSSGYLWVDASSGEPLEPSEIQETFGDKILQGTGIRIVNPEVCGFDPTSQPVYSEVVLEEDFYIPVQDEAEGHQFQHALPEETDLYHDIEKDRWFIRRKAGTTIRVLKSVALDRYVAGQIPDGWDPERYGISRELIRQVDRVTLFNLIATAEAFVQAGMEPAELYEYIHPSDAGSTVGGGLGGTFKLNSVFTDHLLDRNRQNDALQETLINVTAAYAITSYLGSAGPIQTPVAACATGGVSLDMAMNLFQAGKAKFLMAGGFDEISAEGMLGFGDMEATARTDDMLSRGIDPVRMSRPNDSRRGGFVESHGGGVLLLARGDLALEMGLPVYGVVACTATHSEGLHASIPAPGQGLLSVMRDRKGHVSPLRHALDRFGLCADDIAVLYKHDTSTKANDVNENRLHNTIQESLGRDPGNPLPVVSQKSYTGHSKAGAACWQMIGLLQCMQSGTIPGNRSLQNVDPAMNEYGSLLFTDETLHTGGGSIQAGLFSTLGFGHVGAMGLLLSGRIFERCLSVSQRKEYRKRLNHRSYGIVHRLHEMRTGLGRPLFNRRHQVPMEAKAEGQMLMDSRYRWSETRQAYFVPEQKS